MIGMSTATWEWNKLIRFSGHLKHFLNTNSIPNGLIGYTATTPGDPWSTQWHDLKNIMATTWKEDMETALPLV